MNKRSVNFAKFVPGSFPEEYWVQSGVFSFRVQYCRNGPDNCSRLMVPCSSSSLHITVPSLLILNHGCWHALGWRTPERGSHASHYAGHMWYIRQRAQISLRLAHVLHSTVLFKGFSFVVQTESPHVVWSENISCLLNCLKQFRHLKRTFQQGLSHFSVDIDRDNSPLFPCLYILCFPSLSQVLVLHQGPWVFVARFSSCYPVANTWDVLKSILVMPVSLTTQHHNKIHSPAAQHMALLQVVLRHSERISTALRDEAPLQLCVEWLERARAERVLTKWIKSHSCPLWLGQGVHAAYVLHIEYLPLVLLHR